MSAPVFPSQPRCKTALAEFLDKIEGDGYGGMASFEIARSQARDMEEALRAIKKTVASECFSLCECWRCRASRTIDAAIGVKS
jgi:hypothetical protein